MAPPKRNRDSSTHGRTFGTLSYTSLKREMYESAISDAPYSFWHINMMAPKAEMMMIRFEDYMVVD